MRWSIHHITSSPSFLHGNAHAEKAVHVVKQIYMKADDVKLALLLLKMMPISNHKNVIQDAPAKLFYGCQLKAHLPVIGTVYRNYHHSVPTLSLSFQVFPQRSCDPQV